MLQEHVILFLDKARGCKDCGLTDQKWVFNITPNIFSPPCPPFTYCILPAHDFKYCTSPCSPIQILYPLSHAFQYGIAPCPHLHIFNFQLTDSIDTYQCHYQHSILPHSSTLNRATQTILGAWGKMFSYPPPPKHNGTHFSFLFCFRGPLSPGPRASYLFCPPSKHP